MSSTDDGIQTSADQYTAKVPEAQPVVPVPEHKDQLRKRVEGRLGELKAAVAQLGGAAGNERQVRDIEAAVQAAEGSLTGGWEKVGEMEATQLSQWLESSKNLGAAQDQAKQEPSEDAEGAPPAPPAERA
jgi:hypothetical protein